MNIILKQPEIEAAIRMYTERQGISLRNKVMSIAFTSGRGTNGVSVELVIDDVAIPGYNGDEDKCTSGSGSSGQTGPGTESPEADPVITKGALDNATAILSGATATTSVASPPIATAEATTNVTAAASTAVAEPAAEAAVETGTVAEANPAGAETDPAVAVPVEVAAPVKVASLFGTQPQG